MANWWDKNLTDKQKFRLQEPQDPSLLDVVSTVPNPVGDVASGLLAAQDLSKGNYGTAALNSLGLLPFVPSMGAVISGYGKNANEMANILNPLHPNIDADLMGNNAITLSKIIANKKNAGYGTDFMNDLIRLADEKGINTNLSPSSDFGGNKNRLKDFYKQFGFVENKGKNKDFTINESMYREPKLPAEYLYHGTTPQAAKAIEKSGFDLNKSADGSIWFTSNPNIGEVSATGSGAIIKRKLNDKLKLGGWKETDKYSTDELINMGYDGLKLVDNGETTYQIFNPSKLDKVIK